MVATATTQIEEIIEHLVDYMDDPLGFVCFAYPWGQPGTFLADEQGPDEWQAKILKLVGELIQSNMAVDEAIRKAIQIAVKSGQTGVGKTALIAWLIQWFISTRSNPQIVVTANTETQLQTKTWRELAKWHNVFIAKELFKWTATRYMSVSDPATWFAAAIPWSEHNAEGFAGTHDAAVLFIFDESSAIPQVIFDNVQASMNAPEALWLVFGNPTRNEGPFFECFGKHGHRWHQFTIDARDSSRTNKGLLQELIDDWGEDSDFVRIRVKGVFPRSSSNQWIGQDLIDKGLKYRALGYEGVAKILGVDVARYGDCKSVLIARQGRKMFPPLKFMGKSTTQVALEVKKVIDEDEIDYVVISGVGVSAGTVDYLNMIGYGDYLIEINEGEEPIDKNKYFNKRAEMYGAYREWLTKGGELPNDEELKEQTKSVQYGFGGKSQKIQLETKEMMRGRSVPSPDCADAAAMTFAHGMNLPKRKHSAVQMTEHNRNAGLPRELIDDDGGSTPSSDNSYGV